MTKIKICCGTSCYIMGSSELISMSWNRSDIDVEGSTCLGLCKNGKKRPPYVLINDEVYCEVSPQKLRTIVEEVSNAL